MAWFGGVVYHFSWAIIHNIKPNHVDYYHIEGFWNCSMYVRNKYGVKIHTWVETPCRIQNIHQKGILSIIRTFIASIYHFLLVRLGHKIPIR